MKHNIKRLYLDLDCILDTRLATLDRYLPDVAKSVINDQSYYTRLEDSFTYNGTEIPHSLFKPLYELRDKSILVKSNPTLLLSLLHHSIEEDIRSPNAEIKKTKYECVVNVYPYKLKEKETNGLFDLITLHLANSVNVIFIYLEPHRLTPEFVKEENIIDMYLYDGHSWLDYILSNNLHEDHKLLNTKLFMPKLAYGVKNFDNGTDIEEFFNNMKRLSGMVMETDYLPASVFSDVDKIKKEIL